MDNILEKDSKILERFNYDLNNMNPDSDIAHDDYFSRNENVVKQENLDDIKDEKFDIKMDTDLILPETVTTEQPKSTKKKERTKREIEEEEREKMQYVSRLI